MDLETENRLAALLMEEARRLQMQADKEGVGAYLRQPKVRGRPHARFLTATVLGVQQANRAVEVNEMWRAREKELELDNKLSHRSEDNTARYGGERRHADLSEESARLKHGKPIHASVSHSSSKHKQKDVHSDMDDGLRDEEVEEFLQSRTKRGRGAIGSRMDEPGPYPVCTSSDQDERFLVNHEGMVGDEQRRLICGPEKPSWLFLREQQKEYSSDRRTTKGDSAFRSKTTKKDHASGSKVRHSEEKHAHEKSKKMKRKDKPRHHHKF